MGLGPSWTWPLKYGMAGFRYGWCVIVTAKSQNGLVWLSCVRWLGVCAPTLWLLDPFISGREEAGREACLGREGGRGMLHTSQHCCCAAKPTGFVTALAVQPCATLCCVRT